MGLDADSTPECFAIPLLGESACLDANLWYVATLAYPKRSQRVERESFVKGLRAWRIKPVYKLENSRTRARMRQTFPRSDLQMKNEKINGVNHKGMKRVANRVLAGYWAWSLCSNRMPPTFGSNPTTSSGRGMAGAAGLTSVGEGIRLYLSQKEVKQGVYLEEISSKKNAWNLIWSESMPVLHLSVPLYLLVRGFEEHLGKRLRDLLLSPNWVVRALIEAESWREHLQARIPLFEPNNAVCILQKQ